MEFMRAISIVFIVIHVYWYCYRSFVDMGINIGVVDRILLNFQRTAGLFSNLLITKVFAVIFLALSCLGTKGVKNQKMDQNRTLLFNEDGSLPPRSHKIISQTPMGRFGEPEELLGTLRFLIDNDASGFVTGITIPVDGGFSAYSGV